jgi:hypothetical protein
MKITAHIEHDTESRESTITLGPWPSGKSNVFEWKDSDFSLTKDIVEKFDENGDFIGVERTTDFVHLKLSGVKK